MVSFERGSWSRARWAAELSQPPAPLDTSALRNRVPAGSPIERDLNCTRPWAGLFGQRQEFGFRAQGSSRVERFTAGKGRGGAVLSRGPWQKVCSGTSNARVGKTRLQT